MGETPANPQAKRSPDPRPDPHAGPQIDQRVPAAVDFGRETCGDLPSAERREWLVTNGLGGFACGTVAGNLTRRYHGLLIASLQPPLGRTLLIAKVDEIAEYDGGKFALATNRWSGGGVDPQGFRLIERFRLEGTTPVWTYALADALLQKSVWMQDGANTTYVNYKLTRASRPMQLSLKALVNYRDYHATARATTSAGERPMRVEPVERGLRVTAGDGARPYYLRSSRAHVDAAHEWYRNYDLAAERERGLDDGEDHLHAGTFWTMLAEGESVSIVLSTEAAPNLDAGAAYRVHLAREQKLLGDCAAANPALAAEAPDWVRQLALAANQFIIRRPAKGVAEGMSVIAGYPWFGEWTRDTMIALPGLALSTGQYSVARNILRAFAHFADQGMLPNYFPDTGRAPEYNSVDATLWYFQAIRSYVASTQDLELLRELYPLLTEIIDWHVRGTRHNIKVDAQDGLLAAGAPGVQLTWMDAKVGERVITPRAGKPVEVNALWYGALLAMKQFSRDLGLSPAAYEFMAKRARAGFQRFWNPAASYCYDVLDGPDGNEAALRPNQIFVVSLPESPLSTEQQSAILDVCARRLLTSFGLRSLAQDQPGYVGCYAGGPAERDAAYHQGTAWGWLLGPFALAHLRIHRDPLCAASLLEPMGQLIHSAGLGTAGEIFDGDAPFNPRGCFAQAWTVAEILRAWTAIAEEGRIRISSGDGHTAGKKKEQAGMPAPE